MYAVVFKWSVEISNTGGTGIFKTFYVQEVSGWPKFTSPTQVQQLLRGGKSFEPFPSTFVFSKTPAPLKLNWDKQILGLAAVNTTGNTNAIWLQMHNDANADIINKCNGNKTWWKASH